MEIPRPIITYFCSDAQAPKSLKSQIERDLPQEGVEWKRQYRRQIKTVYLEAKFEKFSSLTAAVPTKFEKQLLHTYWIECYDIDQYRSSIRDDLMNWVQQFSKQPIAEWLVVFIDNHDKRTSKTKLLPRSSVVDKIRADFPPTFKNLIDRHIVILTDPLKSDVKAQDSYAAFLGRLRSMLLSAYSKQLASYEEHIRTQRERRNSLNWDFLKFFLDQEELAFAFELLGLFDEALVQYDELDALFSQFILNSNVDEMPTWLQELSNRCDVWHGLCLSNELCAKLRERLNSSKGNLMDLRNYLFARQCELLLLQHKPWEVASRSLSFLHNCVNDFQILKIKFIPGAISCWVYLSALEILLKCERYNDSSQMDAYSRYTIGIRAYARSKLKELGELCGLLPGMCPAPNYLHHVVSLIAGMGDDYYDDASTQSPQSRLKESLSSPEFFLKSYLEFSELTMGTYKHIGRLREARIIGKELSSFYVIMKKYHQSLTFLHDMEKVFQVEKWTKLLADTRKRIFACNEKLGEKRKQLKYALLLSAGDLSFVERKHYHEVAKNFLPEISESLPLRMDELLCVKDLSLKSGENYLVTNSKVHMQLQLNSLLSQDIVVSRVLALLELIPLESMPELTALTLRQTTKVTNLASIDESKPEFLTFHASTVGVKCRNVSRVLKRVDSNSAFILDRDPARPSFHHVFAAYEVVLKPGLNELMLTFESAESGRYKVQQVHVEWDKNVCFVGSLFESQVWFDVHSQEMSVEVNTDNCDTLVAGIEQSLELILNAGSNRFEQGLILKIHFQPGIQVKCEKNWATEIDFPIDTTLNPFEKMYIPLKVRTDFKELQKFSILKYQCDVEVLNAMREVKFSIVRSLNFLPPFVSVFNLHTCEDKKFIEILVKGCCDHVFEVSYPELELGKEIEAEYLGDKQQVDLVFNGEFVHYMWQLKVPEQQHQLEAHFSLQYGLRNENSESGETNKNILVTNNERKMSKYECTFIKNNLHTLFFIKVSVSAQSSSEFCRVGIMCSLSVNIDRHQPLNTSSGDKNMISVMYELIADKNMWNVNGRTAGVLNGDQLNTAQLQFELLPLCSGFLPLPSVRLSKYVKSKNDDKSDESQIEPFEPGQVYNFSRGKQVNVLPSSGIITTEP